MRLLTQDEIDGFRRMPGSFDAMVQAIRAHLAILEDKASIGADRVQPQGEPVAMVVDPYDTPGLQWLCQHPPARGVRLYTYPAQPEGEPVAWINPAGTYAEASTSSTVYGSHTIPLYIHPTYTEGPAWHDAPNAPGLWVVGSRCLHINELDLPIYERSNCRWFGPVPADDGGKP
jgi:hypothetical protein